MSHICVCELEQHRVSKSGPQSSDISLQTFEHASTTQQSPHIHDLHDNVIKLRHFPRNWPFVRGIHRSPVNSPHKGQWRGALVFSLICVWINDWINNREAGDLRRYRAHYDVIVMCGDRFAHYDVIVMCSDRFVGIWLRTKQIFHRIWIAMKNSSAKQVPNSFQMKSRGILSTLERAHKERNFGIRHFLFCRIKKFTNT